METNPTIEKKLNNKVTQREEFNMKKVTVTFRP